tara:strand:- start:5430 stop:6887 length:1458 start_codon:yes stop_codon:yes gene_type:complete
MFLVLFVSMQVVAEQPNLVLIIADDMNWEDNGAYGHPSIHTPNIDRLAEEGMRFDRAYLTINSCSPSRSSIITSRYPHNTGAEQLHWALPPDTKTWVERLQDAGYYTAAAGKWHMGDRIRDHFDTIKEADGAGFMLPTPGAGGEPAKMVASSPSGCEDWLPVLEGRPRDQPFFLWLAALDPHREYEEGSFEPAHTIDDVIVPVHLPDTPGVRNDLRLYYDEIGRLDRYVGKVMTELEAQGVADNTLVLFITDNGRPFPGYKTTTYEGGIKTPWIVRWPAKVKAGQTTPSLISSVDIGPSFLAAAGLHTPDQMVGVSMMPVLQDPSVVIRDYAFAEDDWHDYTDHGRAVMDGDWKLIRNDYDDLPNTPSADAGRSPSWVALTALNKQGKLTPAQLRCIVAPRSRWELYDLKNDPDEINNLASSAAHAKTLHRMQRALADWAKRTADYIPTVRTPDEFDRITGEPDHSVRRRPRPDKKDMFGTYGKY